MKLASSSVCTPSPDLIARTIEGEMLLIPLVAGMVDGDDALYTLSPTAQDIWNLLDGKRTLQDVIDEISKSYESSAGEITDDVLGFVNEMVARSMIVCVNE